MVANDLIMIDISVIVPLFNERESLPELCEWVDRVMKEHSFTYEMILVDDGSTDGSWECVKELAAANSNIHGIQFRRNYGKSAALYCGFERAEGGTVITMDADLQDSPDEIPELYRMINVDDYDVVSGWKQHRQDNKLTKNLPSKLYNATARMITGIKLHRTGCICLPGIFERNERAPRTAHSVEVYALHHLRLPVELDPTFLQCYDRDA